MKMQRLQFIKQFSVDHAEYRFVDDEGKTVSLHVDYSNNQFAINAGESESADFLEEIGQLARGLLARKHAVNLAEKEHYLIEG